MAALWALAYVALGCVLGCDADAPPEVLIVVNTESRVSVAIGEYYAQQRDIAPDRIVRLAIPIEESKRRNDDNHESISPADFERLVRTPLEAHLTQHGLVDEIEIIVTTKGIPLRVDGSMGPAATLLRDATTASVDAEISLLFSRSIGSAGVADDANPFFRSPLSFADFREAFPQAPLRYMVARLTGYQDQIDAETGVPKAVRALIDRAVEPSERSAAWVIDEDPSLGDGRDAGNLVLLAPAAAALHAIGLRVESEKTDAFASAELPLQGYASWGSNARHEAQPRTYGMIDGRRYPGTFGPRSLAVDLVSTNARTFTAPPQYGQSLIADLIALGASGTVGHVDEPTLPAVAHPQILLTEYARGERAIVAYYRALPYLGWMNVYIGDPLMRWDGPPIPELADRDGDGVPDVADNCTEIPNPRQRDTDEDGYGNYCDADIDGDGRVTTSWGHAFPRGSRGDVEWIAWTARSGQYDPNHDLDGDERVDASDISIAQIALFHAPGPSGLVTR